jgi:hypothetical protein
LRDVRAGAAGEASTAGDGRDFFHALWPTARWTRMSTDFEIRR